MTLGFKESHDGAPVRAEKKLDFSCIRIFSDNRPQVLLANDLNTYWRLRRLAKRSERVIENAPVTISETVIEGDGMARTVIINRSVMTTTITRIVPDT